MQKEYIYGAAFILEGETEKYFYQELLRYYCSIYPDISFVKNENAENGEVLYYLCQGERKVLIKFNVVGTISQVVNVGDWFNNKCLLQHKGISWTAFLCYDTDDYTPNISKFYEGDWKELRKKLSKGGRSIIVDIAARADIEDIMLLDLEGVFRYVGVPLCELPSGGKGKSRMKKIFRMKGPGSAYHAGERALPLIKALDFGKIIASSTLPLGEIENKCFKPLYQEKNVIE